MRITPPHRLNLTVVSSRRNPRRYSLNEVVPESTLKEWAACLFVFMNLSWDYIETVLDICIRMRIADTKPLVRRIRDIKRRYDQHRSRAIDNSAERNETETAMAFEDLVRPHLGRLFNGLDFETSKFGLEPEWKTLVIAVHQALTMMEAAKLYCRHCMRRVLEMGYVFADDYMILPEFKELYPLIPQFAGDCYDPKSETRRLTAGILLNEMLKLDIEPYWNDEG